MELRTDIEFGTEGTGDILITILGRRTSYEWAMLLLLGGGGGGGRGGGFSVWML